MLESHRVQQIIINLISNAIKFSKEKSNIYVDVQIRKDVKKGVQQCSISVLDEGIGIHPSEQPNIFQPFFSTASQCSRKMNPNGNGLGLSICKSIAKAINGDITFTSQVGLGTCFTFTMTMQSVEKSAAKEAANKTDDLQK